MWTVPGLHKKPSTPNNQLQRPQTTPTTLPGRSQKFGTVVELWRGVKNEGKSLNKNGGGFILSMVVSGSPKRW